MTGSTGTLPAVIADVDVARVTASGAAPVLESLGLQVVSPSPEPRNVRSPYYGIGLAGETGNPSAIRKLDRAKGHRFRQVLQERAQGSGRHDPFFASDSGTGHPLASDPRQTWLRWLRRQCKQAIGRGRRHVADESGSKPGQLGI